MLENAKSITLNSEMVKAILSGSKNQIRRVLTKAKVKKIYTNDCYIDNGKIYETCMSQGMPDGSGGFEVDRWEEDATQKYSKYKVGDTLWVKETFGFQQRTRYGGVGEFLVFKADYLDTLYHEGRHTRNKSDEVKWESSTRMPKKYARIFLKVTNVRVEKLQNISNDDIYSELNQDDYYCDNGESLNCPIEWFKNLWNLTAKDGYKWEDNPYVFVYEFEKIDTKDNKC